MKSLLNYFVRSIRYRREKKIRCLSEQEKVQGKIRVTLSTVERVKRIQDDLKEIDKALKSLPSSIQIDIWYHDLIPCSCHVTNKYVISQFELILKQRKEELHSMLNEILIQEYDRKDNKAADC